MKKETKRKPGRPDENSVKISISLRKKTRDAVAKYAAKNGLKMSRAIEEILARSRSI